MHMKGATPLELEAIGVVHNLGNPQLRSSRLVLPKYLIQDCPDAVVHVHGQPGLASAEIFLVRFAEHARVKREPPLGGSDGEEEIGERLGLAADVLQLLGLVVPIPLELRHVRSSLVRGDLLLLSNGNH